MSDCVYICTYVSMGTHMPQCAWVVQRKSFGSHFLSTLGASGFEPRLLGLYIKCLYPLSYLTGPKLIPYRLDMALGAHTLYSGSPASSRLRKSWLEQRSWRHFGGVGASRWSCSYIRPVTASNLSKSHPEQCLAKQWFTGVETKEMTWEIMMHQFFNHTL